MTPPICDFCSSLQPSVEYPCPDFTLPENPTYRSEGAWLACAECAVLVDDGRWETLWTRYCKLRGIQPGSAASRPIRLKAFATWSRFAELRGPRRELVG